MKDVPDSVVADGLREYEQWRARREAGDREGSMPSLARADRDRMGVGRDARRIEPVSIDVRRSSARVRVGQPGLFDEEAPAPVRSAPSDRSGTSRVVDARGRERPGGARFGELVHAMLASAPLDADRAAIEALAEVHGRILSAPDEEIAAAVETVQHVLAHELLAPRPRRRGTSGRAGARRR